MVACGSFGCAFLVLVQGASVDAVRYSTLPHLDSLMFGVIAAYAAARWPARWNAVARPAAIAGLALWHPASRSGLALRIECRDANPLLRCGRTRDCDGATGAIRLANRTCAGPAADFVARMSLYSYSMYLVNVPLAKILTRILPITASPARIAVMATVWIVATYCALGAVLPIF